MSKMYPALGAQHARNLDFGNGEVGFVGILVSTPDYPTHPLCQPQGPEYVLTGATDLHYKCHARSSSPLSALLVRHHIQAGLCTDKAFHSLVVSHRFSSFDCSPILPKPCRRRGIAAAIKLTMDFRPAFELKGTVDADGSRKPAECQ